MHLAVLEKTGNSEQNHGLGEVVYRLIKEFCPTTLLKNGINLWDLLSSARDP